MTKPYDPEEYWENRILARPNLQATGHHKFDLNYNSWMYQTQMDCLDELIQRWGIRVNGKQVLDIGSGTGFFIDYYINREAGSVTGVDITKASIEYLREKYPESTFRIADISDSAIAIKKDFDIISAMGILYHIVEDKRFEQALINISGLLRPGGYLFITDSFNKSLLPSAQHARLRALEDYIPILESAQITILEILPLYYYSNRTFVPWLGPWILNKFKMGKLLYQLDKNNRQVNRPNGNGLKIMLARMDPSG
jgi:2-polyprenyl-3-methyl-5-hydroxy-6-metoxy-1,4-benzoquinol methylase